MITLEDLNAAIAECQGERNPDSKTCQKLAAFYIIKERMYPEADAKQSYGASNDTPAIRSGGGNISIGNSYSNDYQSDTEFSKLAGSMDGQALMRIMDELMSVLEATNPRLYRGVIKKMLDNTE